MVYLTGSLNVSITSVSLVAFENQQTSKTVVKSCVQVPEYFYNFVSNSDDELLSCFSIVWSFCFVFFLFLLGKTRKECLVSSERLSSENSFDRNSE